MRRWVVLAVIAAGLLTVAGCGSTPRMREASGDVGGPPAGTQTEDPRSGEADTARLAAQAAQALARWDSASHGVPRPLFVPLAAGTGQLGDWEPTLGGSGKQALTAGAFELAGSLPAAGPDSASVRWPDGRVATLRSVSPQEAFTEMKAESSCGGCTATPLRVTSVSLISATVATSRGPATVPVWAFTLDGTAVRVTRLAVRPSLNLISPAWDSANPPAGLSIDSAYGSPSRSQLTVRFVGARSGATRPCGVDYTTEAVESESAVVVVLHEHAYPGGPGTVCDASGSTRTASVTLTRPVGDRTVLEARLGSPVAYTPSP